MVWTLACAAWAALATATLLLQPRGPAADAAAKARALVERSRSAIASGGDINGLKSLILRGRVRIPQEGSRFDEGQVELKVLLPGRFIRTDTFGATVKTSRDRAQFARLMLGLAAFLVPAEKLTIRSTGEEPFEDTEAVDLVGPSFNARLVFDRSSMVPMRLTYFESGAVSTVMSFADRRVVSGFLLPHRVSTQVPQRVLETLMFDEVIVNPPLTAADFRP